MSAREDADRPTNAARRLSPWRRVAVVLVAGALLGAGFAGFQPGRLALNGIPFYETRIPWSGAPPATVEWPRSRRAGEQASIVGDGPGMLLAVRSFTAAGTASLARDLRRRRLSGVDASSARRASARAGWRSGLASGEPATLPPAGRCAALVRARLLLIAMADPQVHPLPAETPGSAAGRARLARAEAEVVRQAWAVRPESLASAFAECASAEGEWLRAVAAEPSADPRARIEAAWRWHERSFAPALDRVERSLETTLSRSENGAVVTAAFAQALVLERQAPDPGVALFVNGDWGPAPRALPILRTWIVLLAAGALAGSAVALVLCVPWLWPRSRPRAGHVARGVPAALSPRASREHVARLSRDPRQAWDAELGWLHLVSGPDPGRIAHAAGILAGGFVDRGERVLLVDAGERLRLHEGYGGDTRWGLGECLAGEVPLLGAVQGAGRPGFFLLAHGEPRRAGRWDELSGLLEDARGHFDRVLLALDAKVPRAAALPLGGRVLEAWWAEPGPELPRSALALSERLGIPFSCFDLNWLMEATREAVPAAPAQAQGPPPSEDEIALAQSACPADAAALDRGGPAPEEASQPVAVAPGPAQAGGSPGRSGGETVVLGCDLEVRERLRFMIWMRRVRAERRDAALEASAGQ